MASLFDRLRHAIDRLQDPTYTGDRRCWPCTAVNAGILLLACAAVARRRSRSLAAALGAGGATAIAFRGYLVPFTPRFAPRLVSWLPGDPFHAVDAKPASATPDASGSLGGVTDSAGGDTDAEATGEQVLAALLDRGVVAPAGETVYLDDHFRAAWRAEMQDLRTRDDEDLARALGAAAPERTVVDAIEQSGGPFGNSRRWFVVSDGSDDPASERWLTRPVAVAEAAAVRALGERTDLDGVQRAQAAGPLRTFLDACPVCDGAVEETTTVECCGGPGGARPDAPDEVLACEDCDSRLYTFQ
jgi:hypothetical protein